MQTGFNHRRSFRSNDFRVSFFQFTGFVSVFFFFFRGVNYIIQYNSTAYSWLQAGVFVRVLNL